MRDVNWKGIGSDVNWKGCCWKGIGRVGSDVVGRVGSDVVVERRLDPTLLLEGLDSTSIGRVWKGIGSVGSDVVGRVGSDVVGRVGSGRCCWEGIGRDVNWKGLEGLDPDVVDGRGLEGLDSDVVADVVVDCSDRCWCC